MEAKWTRIKGSHYYRSFCPGCGDAMRVTEAKARDKIHIFCEECNPPHTGTGTYALLQSNIDNDPDGWKAGN